MTEYLSHIMYLRKSRQDDPNETVEEVLAKHETILQEYAVRELGGRIPSANIYREIVSGESIEDREEIKKVLTKLEDPAVRGVLCMEPSRLSRGDLSDCSKIIDAFRFTHTLVTTPYMTYDLENKMERKFFQDELLRGNDYLEYTKEILWRGRVASAKRGCYLGSVPPFGYDRVKIGKDNTLKPNENADSVRMIFDWFVNDHMTCNGIALKLQKMGVQSTTGAKWTRGTVTNMLSNVHYIGKIKFNETKLTWVMENGVRVRRYIRQPEDQIIVVEGKHPGIVDPAIFEAAQMRLSSTPKLKSDRELKNVLAGLLRCEKCGHVMVLRRTKGAQPRYCDDRSPYCYKSAPEQALINSLIDVLEQVTLPGLYANLETGADDSLENHKRHLDNLKKQLQEYRIQEDKQFEFLETGVYTQEVFEKRNSLLRERMEECEKSIHLARTTMPPTVDYNDPIQKLEDAIAGLKDNEMSIPEKNRLLRAILERINYTAKDLGKNQIEFDLGIVLKI